MSFFKSLLLAILATLFLTYVLGISILDLFDVDVYMGDELIEPLKAISFAALVAVVLVIVAMAIVLTVFGSILFVGLLVVGALGLAAIGVFWPVLVVAFILWLVLREPKKASVN
ncbi:hypothetical protein [Thalassotalea euphylliae]|uniref:Uncharacterized protein n=1 Tax=Thalassotalea euphylliae TaxID=1655234 RepID=A0A3E0U4D4_9GAMM|nr:hypothetical protein [Thalassotalea euphylliae]REL30832.1 hypothetical protein DXX94_08930 [Thalassotalea euphylliae]